ncbi:sugar phosphate isomerase/epimerase family protein [Dactylosporangium sp. NPDC005572]|uniref:sugar phosphate isomerase/epimerase family protein n=1 Tax=Dactylosporangium sp. NPDC005572 TaxID=3156889 RepID=UPI0033BAFB10
MSAPETRNHPASPVRPPHGLGFSTLGFLYERSLEDTLATIAAAGYREVEIPPVEPHLLATSASDQQLRRLRHVLDDLGLVCRSVNPLDLNLVSPNTEIREFALRHYRAGIRLAEALGADILNIVPGRVSPLRPMPHDDVMGLLERQIATLLDDVRRAGLTMTMETAPFGFVESTQAVVSVVRKINDPAFGVALDCANVYFIGEDPAAAVAAAGPELRFVHVSDTTRAHWGHNAIGTGEIDFAAFHAALDQAGYAGPVLYELISRESPTDRIADERRKLEAFGWRWQA